MIILTTGLSKYFIVSSMKLKYIFITIVTCIIVFILGELLKPIYVKVFKDYVGGDKVEGK